MDLLKNVAKTISESDFANSGNNPTSSSNNNNNSNNNKENKENNGQNGENKQGNSNGDLGDKLMGTINNALGGGEKGEKKEDVLDKTIDLVQEKVFKAGSQDNESAAEQAKDEVIAGAIRSGYKTLTGKEFPISEKQ